MDRVVDGAFDDPGGSIEDVVVEELGLGDEIAGKVTLRFAARDFRGEPYTASGKILLPRAVADDPAARRPVWFSCGYELADALTERHLRRGRIVVTPCDPVPGSVFPGDNPLLRGPNTDYVLAHLARGLPFVDPTAVAYAGGSAGGYATLLVAAEAFPAAVATANCPPVNLGYQAAYGATVFPRIAADPPPDHPVVQLITAAFSQWVETWKAGYGDDFGAASWLSHSPVAHVDRITCRVATMSSTADFLVPIDQISRTHAEPTLANLPAQVVAAAEELVDSPRAAVRLLDVLGDRADVRVLTVPDGAASMAVLDLTLTLPQTLVPVADAPTDGRQWLVNVLEEGPIVLGSMHTRHAVEPDFEPFVTRAVDRGIGVDQLTAAKLDQLIDRWTGVEWLAPGFSHLDRPAAERADVERGIRAYCDVSSAHADRFADLYAALPADRRVLPDHIRGAQR